MKIDKILNNNVIVYLNENNIETIAMGRGLGFGKKSGDEFDYSKVEKVFVVESSQMKALIGDIPENVFNMVYNLYNEARIKLAKPMVQNSFVSLLDHICAVLKRHNDGIDLKNPMLYDIKRFLPHDGIDLKNPMLYDIKRFYREEYAISDYIVKQINGELGVNLIEDEAGFIALNLVNSTYNTNDSAYEITKIMKDITNIVRREFKVELNEESFFYYRFITHLRFFARRLVMHECYTSKDDDLLNITSKKYINSYKCVKKIEKFVYQNYDYKLASEELVYLTIHIQKLIYDDKEV